MTTCTRKHRVRRHQAFTLPPVRARQRTRRLHVCHKALPDVRPALAIVTLVECLYVKRQAPKLSPWPKKIRLVGGREGGSVNEARRMRERTCAARKRLDCFASLADLPSLRVARCGRAGGVGVARVRNRDLAGWCTSYWNWGAGVLRRPQRGPPEVLSPNYGAGYDAGFLLRHDAASQVRAPPPPPHRSHPAKRCRCNHRASTERVHREVGLRWW